MHEATAMMDPTPPQHMQALQRANEVRLARAALKRKVSKGAISVNEVILSSRWETSSMTLSELLTSQSRWGASRCSKLLADVGLPETKTVGSLTERQREMLAGRIS